MSKSPVLIVRANASSELGLGHVYRCASLSRVFIKKGYQVVFIGNQYPDSTILMLEALGITHICMTNDTCSRTPIETEQVIDGEEFCSKAASFTPNSSLCLVDHYGLDHTWETYVTDQLSIPILCIDDLANRPHTVASLLDQNLYDDMDSRYEDLVSPDTQLLLGPTYALLRPEFAECRPKTPVKETIENVVVILGGGASPCLDLIIQSLNQIKRSWNITIIAGLGASFDDEWIQKTHHHYAVIPFVENVVPLLLSADLCIGAGGSMTWERCCLGVPTLAISLSEDQIAISQRVHEAKACYYVGHITDINVSILLSGIDQLLSSNTRQLYRDNGMNMVDGLGCRRVTKEVVFL
ncbi:UDP-2,4-diacetamido-2,4,6-trideoxy-beta-L-altropyranose hydrolase [bacterium]|nr:UDP-2,4-diacetamido-2,4,6-trideoxy-beta-L-altropyranose hydrolase [bacterium]